MLVVTAVTTVVLVLVVETGPGVVVAFKPAAELKPAEYCEQRPSPTWAAIPTSVPLQLAKRQEVTAAWMGALPVPHWQAASLGAQPATEMAVWRQGTAHAGSPLKFWVETRLATAARTRIENLMMSDCVLEATDGYWINWP